MSIDTATPRSRRAILFGALGGAIASFAALAKPPATRAGVDGDLVLEAVNTSSATTELQAATSGAGLKVTSDGPGVVGVGPLGSVPDPIDWKAGVYGAAASNPGVYGHGATAPGVHGASDLGDGIYGETIASGDHPSHSTGAGVHGHGGFAGVLGTGDSSFGVFAQSNTVPALYALNGSATVAAIVAEGDPGTAIHGHANAGGANQVNIPASPALTGIYGSATAAGVAIAADSAGGLAVRATSSAGHAIRGRGQLDGVIGESPGGRSGVVGYSGGGSAPAGPGKTGVYGEATQDSASRGVSGYSLAGQGVRGEATSGQGVRGVATTGQGVRGEATGGGYGVLGVTTNGQGVRGEATTGQAVRGDAQGGVAVFGQAIGATGARGVIGKTDIGVGVRAEATTGVALDVAGKVRLSRSGRVSIPANRDYVDVTVPGGVTTSSLAFAMLQLRRAGVWVTSVRPAYPSATQMRVSLNKVASTSSSTPLAWFVLG